MYTILSSLKQTYSTIAVGGIHAIGTECQQSRHIDNQLRGRSGRKGDPRSSSFFQQFFWRKSHIGFDEGN